MVSLSPPLCAQLLRSRCCRCEVSSTSGHCSSSRLSASPRFKPTTSSSPNHVLSLRRRISAPS
ncbi:hypothetical protein Bca52824_071432 [Brassica carinata]|uniref:Uncharacterized protein n=1 Tax=Brassica carinata TaxID=52824 RepID=A0A8X7Q753_BRACI|nr:hypothetical protein Bca52824_071432 [Brassica carinata]